MKLNCKILWTATDYQPRVVIHFDRIINAKIVDKILRYPYKEENNKNYYEFNYKWEKDDIKRRKFYNYGINNKALVYLLVWVYKFDSIEFKKVYHFRIPLNKYNLTIKKDFNFGSIKIKITNYDFFNKWNKESVFDKEYTQNENVHQKKYDGSLSNKNFIPKLLYDNSTNVRLNLKDKTSNYNVSLYDSIDYLYGNRETTLASCLLNSKEEFNIFEMEKKFSNIVGFLLDFYKSKNLPFRPELNWIDILTFIPTKVNDYVPDDGNGDYVSTLFSNNGDCEDLIFPMISLKKALDSIQHTNNTILKECIKYSKKYSFGLTLCESGGYRFGVNSAGHQKSYHVFGSAIDKSVFGSTPKVSGVKSNPNSTTLPTLIAEGTSYMYPLFYNDLKLERTVSEKFSLIKRLKLGDSGIRILRSANDSDFYKTIFQYYTDDFFDKNSVVGYNIFNKATSQYGASTKQFFGDNFYLYQQPHFNKWLKLLSVYDSRYKVPPSVFNEGKSINKGNKLYDDDDDIKVYSNNKLLKRKGITLRGWLSNKDLKLLPLKNVIDTLDCEITKQRIDNKLTTNYIEIY